jgi:ligand-binding sensor domain-containing protein
MAKAYYTTGIWEHFTVQDGLPDMKIECIFEDHQGRLWIGTHDQGVVCFEGGEFHTYSCREGLSGEGVFSVVEDTQGNLWLGTNRGLTVYDGKGFTSLGLEEPPSFLWGSCRDLQGRLWFGMERRPSRPPTVARWNGKQLEYLEVGHAIGDQGQSIHQVVCDAEGAIWFGGEGLFRYVEGEGFKNMGRVSGHVGIVNDLLVRGKELWGAANNGVWIHKEERFEEIDFRSHPNSLAQSSDGVLWLLTYGGMLFVERRGEFELVQRLPTSVRAVLTCDSNDRLWIGTYGMGIYRYNLKRITALREEHGLPADGITCIAEDKERTIIWAGTREGVVGWDGRNIYPIEVTGPQKLAHSGCE